ncbi:hypothetical protein D3C71_1098520 [compost metagenome]
MSDLEATAFPQQDVGDGHAHVLERHLDVAVGRIVIAQHVQRADDGDALGIGGYQHHALLRMAGCVGVCLAHGDEHRAARVGRAGDPPFAAIDHVLVALALDARLDVGGVARCHVGLRHRKGRADLAVEQRLEPAGLVGIVAVAGNGLHVAGVGCRAVEHLAGPWHAAHDFGQRCVFLVGQARAFVARGGGAIDRQKQVPQPGSLRLGLEVLDGVQRAPALACGCVGGQFVFVGRLVRIDVVIHELEQLGLQFLGFGRVVKVHGFLLRW